MNKLKKWILLIYTIGFVLEVSAVSYIALFLWSFKRVMM